MTSLALLALAAWLWLLLGRGFFWLGRERDEDAPALSAPTGGWPRVAAIVPARDEADVVARSLGSLLAQDYPGDLRIILIDDGSRDGTAQTARGLADPGRRLEILEGAPPPPGWTGKLWAQSQGIERARQTGAAPDFLLLTDADIAHAPDTLRRLARRARAGDLALVSLMARLTVETAAERLLIPAFVFFFAMLYPFAFVNDPRRREAAAAGGCMLASRRALEAAGGLESIAGEIIDDCALAARMKREGPIWLGLATGTRSLRPYASAAAIGRMVSRSAYAQLGYSPWLLAGSVAAMLVLFAVPPSAAIFAGGLARVAGAAAWLAMIIAYRPMLRFYGLGAWRGVLIPLIGVCYVGFTVDSAIDCWRGRGGMWKGRAQAMAARR